MDLATVKNYIVDLIFPRKCLGCGRFIDDRGDSFVCDECLATIPIKGDFACAFCLSPVAMGKTCSFCSKEHFLDRLLVATSYNENLVKDIIKTVKYKFVAGPAGNAAKLMLNYFQKKIAANLAVGDSTVIIPVPLHKKRHNWRGFNQSEIIAGELASGLGLPMATEILMRTANNCPQVEIPEKEKRINNTRGIFKCPRPELIAGKKVMLIDDVSTTGSTLNECARVLKSSGAKEVIGFVFARGDMKSS